MPSVITGNNEFCAFLGNDGLLLPKLLQALGNLLYIAASRIFRVRGNVEKRDGEM
jgi:hypothetical protein